MKIRCYCKIYSLNLGFVYKKIKFHKSWAHRAKNLKLPLLRQKKVAKCTHVSTSTKMVATNIVGGERSSLRRRRVVMTVIDV